jgi:hypothetical protein
MVEIIFSWPIGEVLSSLHQQRYITRYVLIVSLFIWVQVPIVYASMESIVFSADQGISTRARTDAHGPEVI